MQAQARAERLRARRARADEVASTVHKRKQAMEVFKIARVLSGLETADAIKLKTLDHSGSIRESAFRKAFGDCFAFGNREAFDIRHSGNDLHSA